METRIIQIARAIEAAGGRAFYVGGYVRDKMLGIESKDIDVEVYYLELEQLRDILSKFGDVKEVGKSFGVLKLGNIDFSIPRSESKTGKGHKDFDVHLHPTSSFEDACRRRDITINAMLLDILTNELIDPFNGRRDIENKTISHVNWNTFIEDPLRMLRVAQFASRLDFTVNEATEHLCEQIKLNLIYLPKERVFTELEKILIKSEKPSIAFRWLHKTGILEVLFPEISVLDSIMQGTKYHPEGSVFEHTMLALDAVPMEDRTIDIMLAVLLHDCGKVNKRDNENDSYEHITFYSHDKDGVEIAKGVLNRITNDKKITESVLSLVEHHMKPYRLKRNHNISRRALRRLALKANIPDLIVIHRADKLGRGDVKEEDIDYIRDISELYEEIKNEIHPIMKGRHLIDLGLDPSPEFGIILKKIFESQLNGKFSNEEDGIAFTKALLDNKEKIC